MKHNKFTTRTELKSLTRSIKCAETECGRLRMLKVCLGVSSMRLGVPFIAPMQLRAVGGIIGRPKLPSVGWRTGQSGAPPDSHCSCLVRDFLPFLAQPTIATLWQLAHRTVRCPRVDRWSGPRVTRGFGGRSLRWQPLAHRTVRCTTGQSGEL
jgi:hypothetical protein